MLADDASPASLRSYAYVLLSWQRFLRAVEVPWHLAGRAEARDFALWLKTSKKPSRQRRPDGPAPGSVNPVTGKATSGAKYAARTRRHARAVIFLAGASSRRRAYGNNRGGIGRPSSISSWLAQLHAAGRIALNEIATETSRPGT
jgi:hypothetical protein